MTQQDKPYIVEYYYKTKWGYAEEFIRLFKKNHYPILKKEIELGRLIQIFGGPPAPSFNRRRPMGLQGHTRLEEYTSN